MSQKCSNVACNFNDIPDDAIYCPKCGQKIAEVIQDTNKNDNSSHEDKIKKEVDYEKYRKSILDEDRYPNFLKRNWWFIGLGMIKILSSSAKYETNMVSGTYIGDFLFFSAILLGIMTIYWFIRYKVLKI